MTPKTTAIAAAAATVPAAAAFISSQSTFSSSYSDSSSHFPGIQSKTSHFGSISLCSKDILRTGKLGVVKSLAASKMEAPSSNHKSSPIQVPTSILRKKEKNLFCACLFFGFIVLDVS